MDLFPKKYRSNKNTYYYNVTIMAILTVTNVSFSGPTDISGINL